MANRVVTASLTLLTLICLSPAVHAAPPVAAPDSATGPEGSQLSGSVLDNDTPAGSVVIVGNTAPSPSTSFAFNPLTGTFTYEAPEQFSGTVGFEYTIRRQEPDCVPVVIAPDCDATGQVTMFVSPVADVPVVTSGPVTGDEDTAISLGLGMTTDDNDGSEIQRLLIDNLPSGSVLSAGAQQPDESWVLTPAEVVGVTLTPPLNFNGTINVDFLAASQDTATDPGGSPVVVQDGANGSFTVTVQAVNDDPTFVGPIPSIDTFEDTDDSVSLSGVVTDLDGDTITYSVLSVSHSAIDTASVSGGDTLDVALLANEFGSGSVRVSASDGNGGAPVDFDVPVNVVQQNDNPFATGLTVSISTVEDVDDSVDLDGTVDDPDIATNGDSLNYSVESIDNAAVQTASMSGSVLNITVAADQNEIGGSVTVRVTDSSGGDPVDIVVPVDVAPQNDDPFYVGPTPTLAVDEDIGGSVDLDGVVDDVDILTNGDGLNYNVTSIDNAAISAAGMAGSTLSVALVPDQFGSGSVTVTVSDNGGGAPVDVVVPVNVGQTNDDPFPTGFVPNFTTPEDIDASVDLDGIVDDVDIATNGDSLSYDVVAIGNTAVASATMAGSLLNITVLPDQNETGGNVIVEVRDAFGGTPVNVVIPVDVTAVNDDPFLATAVPTLDTDEDVPGSVDLDGVVDDVDILTNGDSLNYAITSVDNAAVDSASMSGSILQISVLPDAWEVGGSISVRVTDDNGGAPVDFTVPVNVGAVNDPPTTTGSVPNVNVLEDAPVEVVDFAGVFSDVDLATGDTLTLSASQNGGDPIFSSISASGTEVSLGFAADANGFADVLVEATDSAGASTTYILSVSVAPVNDAPYVSGSLGNRAIDEDDPPENISLAGVFDDVDGDILSYDYRDVTVPGLFSDISIGGDILVLTLLPDANGVTDITVFARDPSGAESPGVTITVTVNGVDDFPDAADDTTSAIDEDSGELRISVLDNDYLGDVPTVIASIAQVGTFDIIDVNGDRITTDQGSVAIDGDEVVFTPSPNFWGEASFEYVIRDSNGDEDSATVTFDVNPINDPPEGRQDHRYEVLEGTLLEVEAWQGLLLGAFDIDPAQVDADGDPLSPQPLSAVFETSPPPSEGTLLTTASDGSFIFQPTPGFIGETSFTYTVFDNALKSQIGTVTIEVLALPPAGAAPNPGEVAVFFNLANTPLEQSASVEPNVVVTMDDSGSMDWHITIDSVDDNGRFVIDNSSIATSSRRTTIYPYLFALNVNAYGSTSTNGRILPSQESLPAGNDYEVWKARSSAYNGIYYNPEVQYEPWTGLDNGGVDFADADPQAIRLNPVSSSNTYDITTPKSYLADNVPRWSTGGGRQDITVTNYYIPRYYTAGGTRVEIRDDGSTYPGGPERTDCAAADGTCTYDEEIQNFANWFQYYRSRELVAKAALGSVVAELQDLRVGYETINRRANEPVAEMNEYYWEGEKREILEEIYKTDSSGGTPLRRALDDAGRILGCTHGSRDCPSLPVPEGICQQNFSLLFSDGYWNGSAPRTGNFDADGPGIFDGGKYADTHSSTLADIAMYYYENDLFPGYPDGVPLSTADINGVPEGTYESSSELIHQHMKTFTIAFGVEPDIDPATAESADATDTFSWPSPTSAPNAKIDDMLHAAINGRGRFLNAGNPEALRSAVGAAFREFTQAVSSSSAAAFNSTSLREGTLLYRGFYDLRNRTGELTASEVSLDGIIAADPTWTAARLLDADADGGLTPDERVIFTYDPNTVSGMPFRYNELNADQQLTLDENQVNFLRGVRSFEEPSGTLRERIEDEGLLGDIVNSSPVFVGEPRAINRDQAPFPTDDLYSQWVDDVKDRRKIVYVGANDGMLHGFDALTGTEVMGYVPNMILDSSLPYSNKLNNFTSSFYLHDYYVDLSPRLNDVYMRPSTSASKQWMTTLVGGLGAGGKSFFALNVTNPDTLFADENSAKDAVLWEFTDADDTYPVDTAGNPIGGSVGAITDFNGDPVKDMGYSLSLPVITMSNVLDTDNDNEWVAIFGNGTNSTSGIATLFVLFMDRGLDGWGAGDFVKLTTGYGVPLPGEPLEGFPNALGSPTAVDKNLDGTVDLVYAGDRLGNLFRFEVEASNPALWKVVRLFTASYTDSGGNETIQPILSQPLVVKHPEKAGFLVTVGTGSFITEEDGSNTDIQSIYTIWDPLVSSPPTANSNTKATRLVEQVITNVVDDSMDPAQTRRIVTSNPVAYEAESADPGVYGWYIDLDMVRAEETLSGEANEDISGNAPPAVQFPGEKAIRRFIFRDGAILTTTVLPSSNATSCFGSRPGAILIFDALTGGDPGEAIVDFNVDGYVDENDLLEVGGEDFTAGLVFDHSQLDGQLVDLSTLGGEGDTDFLFICGGNECISRRIRDINDAKTGRLSWTSLQME